MVKRFLEDVLCSMCTVVINTCAPLLYIYYPLDWSTARDFNVIQICDVKKKNSSNLFNLWSVTKVSQQSMIARPNNKVSPRLGEDKKCHIVHATFRYLMKSKQQ